MKIFLPKRSARWYYQDAQGWWVGFLEASDSMAKEACMAHYAQAHECAEWANRWEKWWDRLAPDQKRAQTVEWSAHEIVEVGY